MAVHILFWMRGFTFLHSKVNKSWVGFLFLLFQLRWLSLSSYINDLDLFKGSILFAWYKKCLKISKHSLNDSIVFKCVSQYNPIFLFSSHCSRLFLLSKSLVQIYWSVLLWSRIQSITWVTVNVINPSQRDSLLVLSWHFYYLLYSYHF